ncbi:unnamed protein product [Owenia fusiformis]|uniref:Glycosyltransferase 2-like domain-containing protein n=1 Tax=Owenia fusiformis TaxID=6347 RepID=A0A8J1U6G9_OWEFU|nr:unnamed protein product [Owenia fusiformis]
MKAYIFLIAGSMVMFSMYYNNPFSNIGYSYVNSGFRDTIAGSKNIKSGYEETNSGYKDTNSGYKDINPGYKDTNFGYKDTNSGNEDTNSRNEETNSRYKDTNSRNEESNSGYKDTNSRNEESNSEYKNRDLGEKNTNIWDVEISDNDTNVIEIISDNYWEHFKKDCKNGTLCSLNRPTIVKYKHNTNPCIKPEDCVTIITKTGNRLEEVINMTKSIRNYYPKIQIVIINDEPLALEAYRGKYDTKIAHDFEFFLQKTNNVTYKKLEGDIGLSKGRNIAANLSSTKYVFVMDDDVRFTQLTNLSKLVEVLENTDLSISCAKYSNTYFGILRFKELKGGMFNQLKAGKYSYNELRRFPKCYSLDVCQNVFLANREHLLKIGGWDASLKTKEHSDFFINVKYHGYKVAMCYGVSLFHDSKENDLLRSSRLDTFVKYARKYSSKWNISQIRGKSIMDRYHRAMTKKSDDTKIHLKKSGEK